MSSRMTKYYDEPEVTNIPKSRYRRNEELYKEINKSELNNYDIKSNATILGDNHNEIDVEKIKKILDTKYNETPKRKSIRLEAKEEIKDEKETTKEYDINVILERAKEEKQENYEEERLKKLRDTQFDILKNLNLEKYSKSDNIDDEEENLQNLIDTIAYNEKNNMSETALDILSDLRGNDDTEVLNGLKEEIKEDIKKDITDTQMINSFYTSSNALKDRDFEDMKDFSKEIEGTNGLVKIIIAVIILVFIVGIVLIIKTAYFS